jgi:hypothetical protein
MNKQQWPLVLEALKKNNLTWFGFMERMSEKKLLRRCLRISRKRKSLDNDLKKMGIRGLRKIARDRDV